MKHWHFGLLPLLFAAGCGAPVEPTARGPFILKVESTPACGAVTATWGDTNAYSNGVDTGSTDSCGGPGRWGAQYQCVELVMRYFGVHFGLTWPGDAKDLLANAPRNAVDVFSNGDGAHPPAAGDMLVFPAGGAGQNIGPSGHVVLVTGRSSSSVSAINQNIAGVPNGYLSLPYDGATVRGPSGWKWPNAAGWARAKGIVSSDNCATALDGAYCGYSTVDGFSGKGDSKTIYDCKNHSTTATQHCATSCIINPSGADYCNTDNCANAQDGAYCGYSTVDGFSGKGDSKTIYDCKNHSTTGTHGCGSPCAINPSGADYCVDNCAKAEDGAYCGYSTIDGFSGAGDARTIFYCKSHLTTGKTSCSVRCDINPNGADYCG
jgi:hypothetical protein